MKNDTVIVIVTYNGMQWIDKCLKSCKHYPVVVVDNCSSDGTVGFIKRNYPTINVISKSENLGFGQANNIGIKKGFELGYDAVFLLNQDAYLKTNTIDQIVKSSLNNPNYGIISPIHLNGADDKLDENFSHFMCNNMDISFYSDGILKKLDGIYNIEFINAAAWYIPKKTFEVVGFFDSIFFHYGEDENYCQRVLYHGFKIGVLSNCWVNHDREQRIVKPVIPYSNSYTDKMKVLFFIRYADVNRTSRFLQILSSHLIIIVGLFFKAKFSKSIYYIKLLLKKVNWYSVARKSQRRNRINLKIYD